MQSSFAWYFRTSLKKIFFLLFWCFSRALHFVCVSLEDRSEDHATLVHSEKKNIFILYYLLHVNKEREIVTTHTYGIHSDVEPEILLYIWSKTIYIRQDGGNHVEKKSEVYTRTEKKYYCAIVVKLEETK